MSSIIGERIDFTMPPGSVSAYTVSYIKQLEAGEVVEGFAELTGETHSTDQFANWEFEVFGPASERIQEWDGNIVTSQHHDFKFQATNAGNYTIKISHRSRNPKELHIEISPAGWVPLGI